MSDSKRYGEEANRKRSKAMRGNVNRVLPKNAARTFYRRVKNGNGSGETAGLFGEHEWILRLMRDYERELLEDRGGEEQASHAERRAIEIAGAARRCWMYSLAMGELEDASRFMKNEHAVLKAIGFERKAKPVPTIAEWIAEREKADAESEDVP